MFETIVKTRLPRACQKKRTLRTSLEAKRDPKTASAFPSSSRTDDPRVILGVVFEVGILDDADVPGHIVDRRPDGLPFAHVDRLGDDLDPPVLGGQLAEDFFERVVTRAVVDAYQFDLTIDRRGQDALVRSCAEARDSL